MSLKDKKILIVVGGGISAYKTLDLIRLLLRKRSFLKVVLTNSGNKFVTSLSVSSLLKNKVFEEYGIHSHNILTYRILDGDKSDNIGGIKGAGLKTVKKFLPNYQRTWRRLKIYLQHNPISSRWNLIWREIGC